MSHLVLTRDERNLLSQACAHKEAEVRGLSYQGWEADARRWRELAFKVDEVEGGPRVELIHYRDPESACSNYIFVDGVEAQADEVNIDPGAGWERSEWDAHRRWVVDSAVDEVGTTPLNLSLAARARAASCFDDVELGKWAPAAAVRQDALAVAIGARLDMLAAELRRMKNLADKLGPGGGPLSPRGGTACHHVGQAMAYLRQAVASLEEAREKL